MPHAERRGAFSQSRRAEAPSFPAPPRAVLSDLGSPVDRTQKEARRFSCSRAIVLKDLSIKSERRLWGRGDVDRRIELGDSSTSISAAKAKIQ